MSSALKLHLRVLDVYGTTYRVVSPRPSLGVRFSTNYFHGTWHILAACDGAHVLARLMWGLTFQRQPGTVVLIGREHLCPTPFESDRPDPILLVHAGLASVDVDLLRALRRELRHTRPTTIRWNTFGLATAQPPRYESLRSMRSRERMSRRAGFICYTAPRAILRDTALALGAMRTGDYHFLAAAEGEVQIIPCFHSSVSAAAVARREILGGARDIASETQRDAIYDRCAAVLERRREAS